jgi:hypothetical protein
LLICPLRSLTDPVLAQQPFYEAWSITSTTPTPEATTIRVLGLKFKIRNNNPTYLDSYQGIIATQAEIKTLISQIRSSSPSPSSSSNNVPSTLRQLTALTSGTASTISHLISLRLSAITYTNPTAPWAIELLVPWTSLPPSTPNLTQRLSGVNNKLDPGYLLILRALGDEAPQNELKIPEVETNPFRVMERKRSVSTSASRNLPIVVDEGPPSLGIAIKRIRRRGGGSKKHRPLQTSPSPSPRVRRPRRVTIDDEDAKLSQRETETAVNDFLASFSTLYDDMPEEERTKVLDSVKVEEEGEEEDDGETRSSSSGRSLQDD